MVKNPPANAGDIGDADSSLGQADPLQEEVATHSSIFAWKIPWTEEPGGLQSVGLQRVGQAWDSPGKNTGVGCHFLPQCMKVKSESEVTQSCLTSATPWTAAHQAPPSMGFSRQEYAMQETPVRFLGRDDPLEKGTATYSSVHAWRIPMDRGAWRAVVPGIAKSWTRLSN